MIWNFAANCSSTKSCQHCVLACYNSPLLRSNSISASFRYIFPPLKWYGFQLRYHRDHLARPLPSSSFGLWATALRGKKWTVFPSQLQKRRRERKRNAAVKNRSGQPDTPYQRLGRHTTTVPNNSMIFGFDDGDSDEEIWRQSRATRIGSSRAQVSDSRTSMLRKYSRALGSGNVSFSSECPFLCFVTDAFREKKLISGKVSLLGGAVGVGGGGGVWAFFYLTSRNFYERACSSRIPFYNWFMPKSLTAPSCFVVYFSRFATSPLEMPLAIPWYPRVP